MAYTFSLKITGRYKMKIKKLQVSKSLKLKAGFFFFLELLLDVIFFGKFW